MSRLSSVLLVSLLWGACVSPTERRSHTLQAAEQAVRSGRSDRAVALLENILSFDPRDLEARRRMVALELDRNNHGRAYLALQGLPGDVEPDRAFRQLEARVLVAIGDWSRALPLMIALDQQGAADLELIEDLLQGLSGWDPGVELPTDWSRQLFAIQLAGDQLSEAARTARRLPEPARLQALDALFEAVYFCDCSLGDDLPELEEEPTSAWKMLIRHRWLLARGAGGRAAALERDFLARFSDHPERFPIVLSKARREIRQGNPAMGLESARQAAALEPTRVEPVVEKGLALIALDRRPEAIEAFDLALAIDPANPVGRRFVERLGGARSGHPLTVRIEAAEAQWQ